MEDIVDIAVEAGGFKTFVTAVRAVGLVELLKDKGPFTIFAPDDRAFSLLPAGSVPELLKDVPKLKAILLYHVVPGKFTVDEIGQMKSAKTVQGQEIQIDGSKLHITANTVFEADTWIKGKMTASDVVIMAADGTIIFGTRSSQPPPQKILRGSLRGRAVRVSLVMVEPFEVGWRTQQRIDRPHGVEESQAALVVG